MQLGYASFSKGKWQMTVRRIARNIAKQFLPQGVQERIPRLARKLRLGVVRPRVSFAAPPDIAQRSPFPFPISTNNPLGELGEKYLPTKRLHNYLVHYWMHFRDVRFDVRKVVEIGVQTDRSIRMWEEFFPNATIYGIDIDPECRQFEGGRRRILIGDQADERFCARVIEETGGAIDIVIDDGSHLVEHQLKTFSLLFPAMSDHGIYVVEDTGGCVEDQELVTVNALKGLIDSVMYWPKGFVPRDWPHLTKFPDEAKWADKNIIGIAFYRWIVFVMRGRNPQDNPFLTPLPAET
jgi:hypothetical protein